MKFFTRDWYSGSLPDLEYEKRLNDYADYLDSIYSEMPYTLKLLTKFISLHDGIVRKVIYQRKSKNLIFEILSGVEFFGEC